MLERPRRRAAQHGFTIIELLLASVILMIAIGGLLLVFTSGLTVTAASKQRQVANSLLTRAMEQARALPYNTVALGLNASSTITTTDPAITRCTGPNAPVSGCVDSSTWLFNGERVPHGTGMSVQAPLNNPGHLRVETINRTQFTIGVYPTYVASSTSTEPVYRLTTRITWITNGKLQSVTTETLVYSPSGCLSTATHPFGAPCQPFFYSNVETGIGSIQVVSSVDGEDALDGVALERAQLLFPQASATQDIEQITKIAAKGVTSGVSMDLIDEDPETAGSSGAAPQADTDPSSTTSASNTGTFTQTTGTFQKWDSSGRNWLRTITAAGDSGSAVATATASATPACKDVNGSTTIVNNLPCGSAIVQQNGTSYMQMRVERGRDWGIATWPPSDRQPTRQTPPPADGAPPGHSAAPPPQVSAASTHPVCVASARSAWQGCRRV